MLYGNNIVVADPRFNKMNQVLVRKIYAELFGESAPSNASTKNLATKVLRLYAEKIRKPIGDRLGFNLAACEVCNSLTDANLDSCPMCGDGADVELAEPPQLAALSVIRSPDQVAIDALKGRSEGDLDKIMHEVNMSIDDAVLSFYRVGELVDEIMTRQLWRLRTDALGNPAYKNPGDFAKAEIGRSIAYVYSAARVVRSLSLQQVRELGIRGAIAQVASKPEQAKQRPQISAKKLYTLVFDETDFTVPMRPSVEVIDDYGVPLHGGAMSVEQNPSAVIEFPTGALMNVSIVKNESGELQLHFVLKDKG